MNRKHVLNNKTYPHHRVFSIFIPTLNDIKVICLYPILYILYNRYHAVEHYRSRQEYAGRFQSVQVQTFSTDADSSIPDGIISYLREDIYRRGVLLGLISNNLVEILPRGNATYTISLYANITDFLSSDFVPISNLRSFYQLEDEILLVDGGLKCIHSLSKDKSEVTTHSGNCTDGDETYISFVQDLNAIQSPSYATDGSFSIATYAKPRE